MNSMRWLRRCVTNTCLLGHDYIVLGTLERKSWRAGVHTYSMKTVFENLHDFKRDLVFEPLSYGWRKE
jgi:hypothetical protein